MNDKVDHTSWIVLCGGGGSFGGSGNELGNRNKFKTYIFF